MDPLHIFQKWLKEHLQAAKSHYNDLCKLDDQEYAKGGSSEFYEQALQMFGYVAALETCMKQVSPAGPKRAVPRKAVKKTTAGKAKAKAKKR